MAKVSDILIVLLSTVQTPNSTQPASQASLCPTRSCLAHPLEAGGLKNVELRGRRTQSCSMGTKHVLYVLYAYQVFNEMAKGITLILSGTNTRVPEEEELMVINIDLSEQSRARLQLQPTPRCAGSASPDLSGATPDRSPYSRQPL